MGLFKFETLESIQTGENGQHISVMIFVPEARIVNDKPVIWKVPKTVNIELNEETRKVLLALHEIAGENYPALI